MRVTSVKAHTVTKSTADAPWNPRTAFGQKTAIVVTVRTDEGVIGVGESWCAGGGPRAVIAVIEEDYAPLLVGEDPSKISAHWSRMYNSTLMRGSSAISMAALSGIDIALWDIAGKVMNAPVHRLLGGDSRPLPVYASGGLYGRSKGLDNLAEELSGYVSLGFRGVKMKVGGESVAMDVARVRTARKSIGDEPLLMVDALYNHSLAQAIEFVHATQTFGIHFYEAPLHPADLVGLRSLHEQTGVSIAGNEIAIGPYEHMSLIRSGAFRYLQFDSTLCGGITEGLRIASLARANHIFCSLHSSSTVIALSANLQIAAAIDNLDSVEFHMIHQLLFAEGGYGCKLDGNGMLPLPQGPGLGLNVALSEAGR